jgi:hypothetical protein
MPGRCPLILPASRAPFCRRSAAGRRRGARRSCPSAAAAPLPRRIQLRPQHRKLGVLRLHHRPQPRGNRALLPGHAMADRAHRTQATIMLKLNYRFKHPGVTTVALTAHPLQRAGAFALAVLAGIRHPLLITEADLLRAVESMHAELRLTAHPADSKDSLDAEELAGQLVTLADLVGEPDTSMQAAYRGKATLWFIPDLQPGGKALSPPRLPVPASGACYPRRSIQCKHQISQQRSLPRCGS